MKKTLLLFFALILTVLAFTSCEQPTDTEIQVDFMVGDEVYETITVAFGKVILQPKDPIRDGYTFEGWDYDLENPVLEDLKIYSKWTANSNTPYEVEHYIEKSDGSGYELYLEENLTGTTDTKAVATVKDDVNRRAFLNDYPETVTEGNIAGDGSLVLKLYYGLLDVPEGMEPFDFVKVDGEYVITSLTDKSAMSVVIPDCVSYISNWAFGECQNLESVTIGNGVKHIGAYSFYNCRKLKNLSLGQVEIIDECAFMFCKSLESLVIPDSVKEICWAAFSQCENLTDLDLGEGVEIIKGAFEHSNKIGEINIPASLKVIEKISFSSVKVSEDSEFFKAIDGNLYSKDGKTLVAYARGGEEILFTVPDGVETVCDFGEFDNITVVSLPDSIKHISSGAFLKCENLTYNKYSGALYLGNKNNPYLVFIGYPYTINPHNGETVTIHSSTKVIAAGAFSGIYSLEELIIPDSVEVICDRAFSGSPINKIVIGKGVKEIGQDAFQSFTVSQEITLAEGNEHFEISDGVLYTKDGKELILCLTDKQSYVMPDSVEIVRPNAFANAVSLESLTLSKNLKTIGAYAFSGKKITEIIIPEGVVTIESGAFLDCSLLAKVTLPDSLKSIESYAFYKCAITEIVIPSELEKIGMNAFECQTLKSVTFSDAEGWVLTTREKMLKVVRQNVKLSKEDLSQGDIAAQYLKSDYVKLDWKKQQ